MAKKIGAGGKPQEYNEQNGQYGCRQPKKFKQNTSYSEILAADIIQLPDETFPRSVGAKWANYEIELADGEIVRLQEGSRLHHKEVFAGKGTKIPIREVDRLVEKYGGKAENWQKIKAIGTIEHSNGEIEEIEIHWYEEPQIGRVKLKEKKIRR